MKSNKKNLLVPVLAFAVSLILVACSSGGDDKKTDSKDVAGDLAQYSAASCEFKYEQGPIAAAHSSADIKISYFRKKIDFSLLKPVLPASASEVVHFAETTNVRFYKTSAYKANTCEMMAALPVTPSDIENEFSSSGNDTLGLYLPANSKALPSTHNLAAITVRKDANKWVLVHEYVHHLFELQFATERLDSEDLRDKANRIGDEFDVANEATQSANSSNKKGLTVSAAAKLEEFSAAIQTLMEHFFLEEMTIETTLGEKLVSGEFQLVEPMQRFNGAAYIISSSKKADKYFEYVKNQIYLFKIKNSSNLEYSEIAKLDQAVNGIEADQKEMASLVAGAKRYINSKGYDYNGIRSFKQTLGQNQDSEFHCAHGEIPQDIENRILKFNRQ